MGSHKLQGLAPGEISDVFNFDEVDEIVLVTTDEAFQASRKLAKTEALLVGISFSAAAAAAEKVAERPECKGKNVGVILSDTGER